MKHSRLSAPGRLLVPGLIAVLMLGGCGRAAKNGPGYEYATVTRGDVLQHVTASGSLSAVVSVDVGSQVSGKIIHLFADFNSPVRKGQLVAEIDTTVYEAQLQQAQGDLASARAEVTLKRQNLERKKVLVPLKAASQLDLDQATAELAQAEAAVTIKEAATHSAQANLGYCKINSPVDGIVISRKVDEGQTVIAAMNTPVLFTIARDITKMNITADVSEADIGQVKTGEDVEFGVDAFPNEVFHGKVSQVRKSPTTTQNVVTYQTIIDVNNPEQKLFPGMTANVSILVLQRNNVLIVPNASLRYSPPEKAKFSADPPKKLDRTQQLAYELQPDNSTLTPRIVHVGATDGVSTEILDGLAQGGHVVTATLASGISAGVRFGPPNGGPPPQL